MSFRRISDRKVALLRSRTSGPLKQNFFNTKVRQVINGIPKRRAHQSFQRSIFADQARQICEENNCTLFGKADVTHYAYTGLI